MRIPRSHGPRGKADFPSLLSFAPHILLRDVLYSNCRRIVPGWGQSGSEIGYSPASPVVERVRYMPGTACDRMLTFKEVPVTSSSRLSREGTS